MSTSEHTRYITTLSAAVVDGICQLQTPGVGGPLTLNGSLVSGGIATLDTSGQSNVRQVFITCNGNDAGRTFTISGTLVAGGAVVTETVAGSNMGTSTSLNLFLTVTGAAVDSGTAGSVELGTNGVGASPWFLVPPRRNEFSMAIGTYPTGTVNWTVQFTLDQVFDAQYNLLPTVVPYWFSHSVITGVSSAIAGNFAFPPTAVRTLVNSGTGTVTSIFNQNLPV